MAKHRRALPPEQAPPPRPVHELLLWTCFACALVPIALVWSGAGWSTAIGAAGLLALLLVACGVALRLAGLTTTPRDRRGGRGDDGQAPP